LSGWHAWIIGVPVLAFLGLATADQAARLLPNLL
jgi:sortase A